jgi:hypothetical protein
LTPPWLEWVLALADVEFDELAGGVFVEDDGRAAEATAPEEGDVAAGGVAASELFRVGVESEAVAVHFRLRSLYRFHRPQLYARA